MYRSYVKLDFKNNFVLYYFCRKSLFLSKKRTFTDYVWAEFCKESDFQQGFHQSPVQFFFVSQECQQMGTWFWYHLKAKNALSLNMATNSAAYSGIFIYSPKKKKK